MKTAIVTGFDKMLLADFIKQRIQSSRNNHKLFNN